MSLQPVDVAILGGGPTGLFAAFYAGMREMSCKIIDAMPTLGGRLSAVYPEKFIYDVPGFPKILARNLVENLAEQALTRSPLLVLGETVKTLSKSSDGLFELTTDVGSKHRARTVLLATGVGTYSAKKHKAPGASQFENHGLSYAVVSRELYRNKKVAILGGGDSALDWAHELLPLVSELTVIHRTNRFRAHEESLARLKSSSATLLTNTEVIEFQGDATLHSLRLKNTTTGDVTNLEVDEAIVMFGFNSHASDMAQWGLNISGDYVAVNERMETNIAGVYAAGDIVEYPGKIRLIATGFSEGTIAINFAKTALCPDEAAQPLHSTTLMEIAEASSQKT